MALIEIITNPKSEEELKRVIDKGIANNNEVMFIKEKNLENIKNIKLETVIINAQIENEILLKRIIDNSKYLIVNSDFIENIKDYINGNQKIITYGYNSKSDITISSVEEEKSMISLQRNISSIYGKTIEMQEIKANVNCQINVYNIMIVIALTILYAR